MDELRGPTIQLVLHIKEGLGFGFLRSPFIVSGSLNGYVLETDPTAPCHAPVFDAELVWEADKRRFRSLRMQNVPLKVEVFSLANPGCKDKVGYFMLSLLGAQPCPSNKIVDLRHTWHRLLGLKSEAKCCQPQLLMSLSIEDRVNTVTPRNELNMFHSTEVAYASSRTTNPPVRSILFTLKEYIAESKKTVSDPSLQPRLLSEEGLIQIGDDSDNFLISLVIGRVDNLDLLLPDYGASKEPVDCYITYSVFTHDIQTNRVSCARPAAGAGGGVGALSARFSQRTSLRVRSSLPALAQYFAQCPHLVTRVAAQDNDVGICSLDLRKLIPTEDLNYFISTFCTNDTGFTIHERCFLLRCDERNEARDQRRPYIDIEISFTYIPDRNNKKSCLTARSATQLPTTGVPRDQFCLDNRSGSCTDLRDVTHVASARYINSGGDGHNTELTDLIKKMYETFQESQKLLETKLHVTKSDMQVQCGPGESEMEDRGNSARKEDDDRTPRGDAENEPEPIKLESCKSDTYIGCNGRPLLEMAIPALERNELMQRYVEELEDWKEKQQTLFKAQLKQKEDYHLEMLSHEWAKKQTELEHKLTMGVERCRQLAADLARATTDFRLKGGRNNEREHKLLEAKKALEAHYTCAYQELRVASSQLEADMQQQLQQRDLRIQQLEQQLRQCEKDMQTLQNNIKNSEKENESKYSGLTKDQTASLIQELRCLEEKLDSATRSKAFFKEQWGRAVRELHLSKLRGRTSLLQQLHRDRRQLGQMGLDSIRDEDFTLTQNQTDIKKLKDDFYVDLLANTPALDPSSTIEGTTIPDGMEMYNDLLTAPKNPLNEKLTELISQRDQLIQQDNPDEEVLKQLNHEIRSMLLNYGT